MKKKTHMEKLMRAVYQKYPEEFYRETEPSADKQELITQVEAELDREEQEKLEKRER